jgi:hypothetical protein
MKSDESDWAWFAGLFEGEGSISFRGKNSVSLYIGSTDQDVLQRVRSIVGGNVGGPYKHRDRLTSKPYFQWRLYQQNMVEQAIERIKPYLLTRRSTRLSEAQQRLDHIRPNKGQA